MTTPLQQATDFINAIGIPCQSRPGASNFLNNCAIEAGAIFYDPETISVSNLLHEVGHIATIPSAFRSQASGNLNGVFKTMAKHYEQVFAETMNPDLPELRAIIQCGDTEATAWAYAAGVAMGLDDEVIIEDQDYDFSGDAVRLSCALGHYAGINGLRASGFLERTSDFPRLKMWLQL